MSEDTLLTTAEVAKLFSVTRHTVVRWEKEGKIEAATRTLGGHRRFRETDVRRLLAGRGGNS